MADSKGVTMNRVYLAGAINGKTDEECNAWRNRVTHLLSGSMVVVSPMARDYRGKEDENVAEIVAGDIKDIESCDYVLANAESPSWGTAMELWHAHKAGKKIVTFMSGDRVSPWLRFVCSAIYDSPEMACMAILNFDVLVCR